MIAIGTTTEIDVVLGTWARCWDGNLLGDDLSLRQFGKEVRWSMLMHPDNFTGHGEWGKGTGDELLHRFSERQSSPSIEGDLSVYEGWCAVLFFL